MFVLSVEMTGKGGAGNTQKQEASGFSGVQKICVDQIKEDGIRKELYENERKAQEKWFDRWGYLINPNKLWNNEALKRGLPLNFDVFEKKDSLKKPKPEQKSIDLKINLTSREFPKLSSEMIGWRSLSKDSNLNNLAGPAYISPKQTMNPPLSPEEPDLRYQRIIFLG